MVSTEQVREASRGMTDLEAASKCSICKNGKVQMTLEVLEKKILLPEGTTAQPSF